MLTPIDIVSLPDEIMKLYAKVETQILNEIVERLILTGYKEFSQTSVWQIYKLQELKGLSYDVKKVLARAAKVSEKKIEELMNKAIYETIAFDDDIYICKRA